MEEIRSAGHEALAMIVEQYKVHITSCGCGMLHHGCGLIISRVGLITSRVGLITSYVIGCGLQKCISESTPKRCGLSEKGVVSSFEGLWLVKNNIDVFQITDIL